MAVFAIDVDAVVAALDVAWLERYNLDYDDDLTPADLHTYDTSKYVKPECGVKIYEYLKDPTLYDDVVPISGALDGINVLRHDGHRVIFVTTTPIETAGRKFHWLVEHGFLSAGRKGLVDYYEAIDKSLIDADILLDDAPHNVENFQGRAILFDQPWNQEFKWTYRVFDWSDFIDIYHRGILGLHPTELRRPQQTKAFRELLEKMYITHLDKNFDYSPANILGTGEIGLATRTWDKVARMMNLTGFDVEIEEATFTPNLDLMGIIWNKFIPLLRRVGFNVKFSSITYREPKKAKNESLEDSIIDLAVYCLIWLLERRGKWGK